MEIVTKENQEGVQTFFHITATNSDGTPLRARRNGKTKTWKTRPKEFSIPVKYGMYNYFYINAFNCHQWQIL